MNYASVITTENKLRETIAAYKASCETLDNYFGSGSNAPSDIEARTAFLNAVQTRKRIKDTIEFAKMLKALESCDMSFLPKHSALDGINDNDAKVLDQIFIDNNGRKLTDAWLTNDRDKFQYAAVAYPALL